MTMSKSHRRFVRRSGVLGVAVLLLAESVAMSAASARQNSPEPGGGGGATFETADEEPEGDGPVLEIPPEYVPPDYEPFEPVSDQPLPLVESSGLPVPEVATVAAERATVALGDVAVTRVPGSSPEAASEDVTTPVGGGVVRAGWTRDESSQQQPGDAREVAGSVTLDVLDEREAAAAGFNKVAVVVAGDPSSSAAVAAAEGTLSVGVDYSTFRHAYGGNWDERLRLVWFEPCWLEASRSGTQPDASCPDPLPIDSHNDVEAGVITAEIDREVLSGAASRAEHEARAAAGEVADAPAADGGSGDPVDGSVIESPSVDVTGTPKPGRDQDIPAQTAPAGEESVTAQGTGSAALAPSAFSGGGFAMMAGGSSEAGTYEATSLSAASAWEVGMNGGSFRWTYNLPVPPVPAGPAPDITLAYDSGRLDGLASDENNQGGVVPNGWSLATDAFIERRLTPCNLRFTGSPNQNNCFNATDIDNATISLAGHSGILVRQVTSYPFRSGAVWQVDNYRLEEDTGLRVQRWKLYNQGPAIKGAVGKDNDREFFYAVDTDGTEYWFGYNLAEGSIDAPSTTAPSQDANATTPAGTLNSVMTVPVVGVSGEPCYAASHADSWCHQAYRWMLDRVVTAEDIALVNLYWPETNRYDTDLNGGATQLYSTASPLRTTWYGVHRNAANDHTAAAAHVDYEYEYRCISPGTCTTAPTTSNGASFPDIPNDMICGTTCSHKSPTYFQTKRVTDIVTSRRTGTTGYAEQEFSRLLFGHEMSSFYSGEDPQGWLRAVRRQGTDENGGTIVLPQVILEMERGSACGPQYSEPNCGLRPNRANSVLTGVGGVLPLMTPRLNTIADEYGRLIKVEYSAPDTVCSGSGIPGGSWAHNDRRCFPAYYDPDPNDSTPGAPIVFNKYVAEKVTITDRTGKTDPIVTDYVYNGGVGWMNTVGHYVNYHKDYRGYHHVDVIVGSSAQARSSHYFMRGMDGHNNHVAIYMPNSGTPKQDIDRLAGWEYKTEQRSSASSVYSTSWTSPSWLDLPAPDNNTDPYGRRSRRFYVGETFNDHNGAYSRTLHTVDSVGRAKADVSYGAVNSSWNNINGPTIQGFGTYPWALQPDDRCTIRTYTATSVKFPEGLVGRTESRASTSTACNSGTQWEVTETYHDGNSSYTSVPTVGQPTKVNRLLGYGAAAGLYTVSSGGSAVWQTEQTGYEGANTWRRPNSYTDARNNTTSIVYDSYSNASTITSGGNHNVERIDTNEPGSHLTREYFDELGHLERTVDPNNRTTWTCHDGLGRLIGVWHNDNAKSSGNCRTQTATASERFEYTYQWTNAPEPYFAGGPHVPNWLVTAKTLFATTSDSYHPGGSSDIYLDSVELYDGLGRVVQRGVRSPQGGWAVSRDFYDDKGRRTRSSEPQQLGDASGVTPWAAVPGNGGIARDNVTEYDTLGRVTQTQLRNNDTIVRTQTTSYPSGMQSTVGVPVDAGSSNPYGSTTTTIDVYGNVVQVDEQAPGLSPSTYTTYRGYDMNFNLRAIKDPIGTETDMHVNLLGWTTAVEDPNAGNSKTEYYETGAVRATRNAENTKVSHAIDTRGRVIRTAVGNNPWDYGQRLAEYHYDPAGGIGQVRRAVSFQPPGTTVAEEFSDLFDSRGRRTVWTNVVHGADDPTTSADDITDDYYVFTAAFTRTGQPLTSSYPAMAGLAAETVTHHYDSLAQQLLVTSPMAPSGYYVSSSGYDAIGRPQYQNTGAGSVWLNKVFSFNSTDGRLYGIQATARGPGTDDQHRIQGDFYTYDAAGNPTEILHNPSWDSRDERECFYYDSRQRLIHGYTHGRTAGTIPACAGSNPSNPVEDGPAPYDLNYVFDAADRTTTYANRTGISYDSTGHTGCLAGTATAKPAAMDAIGAGNGHAAETLEHDCNGSIRLRTAGGTTTTYAWDAYNRLTDVTVGTATTEHLYDVAGSRVVKIEPDGDRWVYFGTTEMFFDKSASTVTATRSYPGGAMRELDGNLALTSTNHHDSIVATLNTSDGSYERVRYDPYGAIREGDTVTEHGFLNEVHDDTTELVYLNHRHHDPATGTFVSVDPLVRATLQAYIYGEGNPARVSDPTGLCGCEFFGVPYNPYDYVDPYSDDGDARKTTNNVIARWNPNAFARDTSPGPPGSWENAALIGGFVPKVGEAIDGYECSQGSVASCAALPLPFVGGRFLDEFFGFLGRLSRRVEPPSAWELGNAPRGFAIEDSLGGNLPRSFPTIDRFADGTATSIKSIDLSATTYQNPGRLRSRLSGYVDQVSSFDGAGFDGIRILPGETTARELVVAIPPGAASAAQQSVIDEVIQYGASIGVGVRMVEVP